MTEPLPWSEHVADWRRQVHALYADVRAEPDTASAHAMWVGRRTALFDSHPASARQPGQTLRHAPYDPAFRFVVAPQPAEPEEWRPATGSDGEVPFVPMRDATAGKATYGAGRYVLDTVKGADLGHSEHGWVVDLNFAYSPSCAYDPAWACPLAPAGNRLEAEVPVGELNTQTD
jgi:uncharacterized protein (DUF1684 family)